MHAFVEVKGKDLSLIIEEFLSGVLIKFPSFLNIGTTIIHLYYYVVLINFF